MILRIHSTEPSKSIIESEDYRVRLDMIVEATVEELGDDYMLVVGLINRPAEVLEQCPTEKEAKENLEKLTKWMLGVF